MAASLRGVGEEWFRDAVILNRCRTAHSAMALVVLVPGQPMALQDKTHALLNKDLIVPVLHRMASARTLLVNSVDEFRPQVVMFGCRLNLPADLTSDITDDNCLDRLEIHEDDLMDVNLMAHGIKRCVAFVRKAFLRQHEPQDRDT